MRKLNFGCGNKPIDGFMNVDIQEGEHVDKSFDFLEYPYPLDDNRFDYIVVDNVLEHLESPRRVLRELRRVMVKGGLLEIIVPYYNSFYAYADDTHVNFFNEIALYQALGDSRYTISSKDPYFEVVSMELVPQRFLRFLPFRILDVLRRFLGNVIVEIRLVAKAI